MGTVNAINNTSGEYLFVDLRSFSIAVSGTETLSDYFSPSELAVSDTLILGIASNDITINNGDRDLTPADAVRYIDLYQHVNPLAPDGREIIRCDSRPVGTNTYFTTTGDSATDIGDGTSLRWDFSNDDDMYTYNAASNFPPTPSGMKVKKLDLSFMDLTYLKDGTVYFFDAPWNSFASMYVVVPAGNYYPNPDGAIPSEALGLPAGDMYSYAVVDIAYARYVNKHYLTGTCPMGDELNAEGSQVDPVPIGWYVRALIHTNSDDNVSKGYASFELYRDRSILLPGGSV